MAILVFIIILSILIVVHEWGHFITAKKCGVKVEQFSLGFGPKLWSRIHDGTEFCLCAVPLGGYVKMAGDERSNVTGKKEEFLSQPIGHKSLIVVMGPVINLVFAYLCLWFVFMLGRIESPAIIGQVQDKSPAFQAGLMIGDKIQSIDQKPVRYWSDLQNYVSNSKSSPLDVVINRNGQIITKQISTQDQMLKDIFGQEHKTKLIGVSSMLVKDSKDAIIVRYGPIEALGQAAFELGDISVKTYQSLYEMIIGLRSPKELMGPVGVFVVIKSAFAIGFSCLLHIVGIISASLALFNLLPIIPLDGGHLLLFLIEKIRGKALSQKFDETVAKVGISLILTLALFVFYVDFERIGLISHIIKIFRG